MISLLVIYKVIIFNFSKEWRKSIKEDRWERTRVGASIYASRVITETVERRNILSNENTNKRRRAINIYLKDNNMHFRNNRNDEMTEIYANSLALANNHQPRNAIQKQSGSDTTLGMKGEVLHFLQE